MKKIILIAILMMCASTFAQVTYSTDYRQECVYNQYSEEYDQCDELTTYVSRFVFAPNGKLFTHTTSDIESTYYVTESQYDYEDDLLLLAVKSDVGNTYLYSFPKDGTYVVAMKVNQYVVKFRIKAKY